MNRFRRLLPGTRWMAWAAVGALLLAGLLGPLHRGLHPGAVPVAQATPGLHTSATASLFAAHDDGDAQCRLLDQALQAHGTAAAAAWSAAVVPQAAPLAAATGLEGRRAPAAYLARAPPGAA